MFDTLARGVNGSLLSCAHIAQSNPTPDLPSHTRPKSVTSRRSKSLFPVEFCVIPEYPNPPPAIT